MAALAYATHVTQHLPPAGQIRMFILLDENFPLRLYTRLQNERLAAQHILLTDPGSQGRPSYVLASLTLSFQRMVFSALRASFSSVKSLA